MNAPTIRAATRVPTAMAPSRTQRHAVLLIRILFALVICIMPPVVFWKIAVVGVCVRCSCSEGYTLDSDGINCNDVNECEGPSPCQQVCSNVIGSYECSCFDDRYILEVRAWHLVNFS